MLAATASAMLRASLSQKPHFPLSSLGSRAIAVAAPVLMKFVMAPWNWALYGGTGRLCPVCGRTSRKFATFGDPPRQEARCVWCSSLERHRLVFLYFQRRLASVNRVGGQALHVAPEKCLEPVLRRMFGDGYRTGDIRHARADVRLDVMDIEFADETFDFIYCSHVLEHVEDDRKAMRELRRVLKKDGIAVLLVPILRSTGTYEDATITDPAARARAFGQKDHVRVYGQDYVDRLVEAGFTVEVLSIEDLAKPEETARMNLSSAAGAIHVCRRRPE